MNAVQNRPAQPSRVASNPLGAFTSHKSVLLERANPGVRRSTPDSEALASSDDETENTRTLSSANASQPPKPARRTSWLDQIPSSSTRRPSTQLSAAHLANEPHPETPSADLAGWPTASVSPKTSAATGWGSTSGSPFPWGTTGIWNDSRKDHPLRRQEVLSQSTGTNPQAGSLIPVDFQSPFNHKPSLKENAIPFSIPLHPTPKTYRSQSYSVGQLEPDPAQAAFSRSSGNFARGRGAGGCHTNANLQHCPSRPSVLGELGHDSGTLGRVREVDDDDEDQEERAPEINQDGRQARVATQARTIEQLTLENAILRQAANGQYENRMRERTGSSISATSGFSMPTAASGNHRMHSSALSAGGELAVEDQDELASHLEYGLASGLSRITEQSSNSFEKQPNSATQMENRNSESAKRAQWQTSLGFGSIPEIPQSRRHSFADVPTRQGSIGSTGKSALQTIMDLSPIDPAERDEGYGTYGEDMQESQGNPRECCTISPDVAKNDGLEVKD
jgi:hypothetical protein